VPATSAGAQEDTGAPVRTEIAASEAIVESAPVNLPESRGKERLGAYRMKVPI
jgi:hypothetical protein